MRVSSVGAKTFGDRRNLALVTGAGLAALAVFGVWMYSGLGASLTHLVDDLPEAFAALVGSAGSSNYVVSELFSLIAPVVVLIVAISGGVAAIAGEERDRTAGLLLAQPVTRRQVVSAKAGVMVAHVAITTGCFLLGFLLASALFDTGVSTGNAIAACVHLLVFGVALGLFALALSAATGSVTTSGGTAAAAAVLTNLMATMLPLVHGLRGLRKVSPWYYYDGSQPLRHGLAPAHLAVLAALALGGLGAAIVAVDRHDIEAGDDRGLLARIRAFDRITTPKVTSVFAKALSERTILVSAVGGYGAALTVAICLMFHGLQDTLWNLSRDLPAGVRGMIGTANLGTPAGWISGELLSLLAPLAVIGVAVSIGCAAIAGEEKRHTLGLLLGAPVTRRQLLRAKSAALVCLIVAIVVLLGLGLVAGSALAGLRLGVADIAAAMTHLALLGIFFGSLAIAVGSATTHAVAVRVTSAAAVLAYLMQAFLPLSTSLAGGAALSPWHYYSASDPLSNGADLLHLAVLVGLSVAVLLTARVLVERRDVVD